MQANTGNVTARTITRSGGENDFVAVQNGELYHMTYDPSGRFNIEWIENSIIEISDVEMHDIDLDGDLDAICFDAAVGQFNVYEKADGRFVFRPDWNFGSKPHFLHSQDYDGDGTPDLMINHRIYRTTGPNEWEYVYRYPLLNTYYYKNVHFMDYDSDGDQDILFHQVHRLWVLRNFGGDVSAASVNVGETNDRTTWNRVIKTTDGEKIIYYDRSAEMIKELVFLDSATYEFHDLAAIRLDPQSNEVWVEDVDDDGNEELIINSFSYRDIAIFKYDPDSQTGTVSTTKIDAKLIRSFGMFELNDKPAALVAFEDQHDIYTINPDLSMDLVSSVKTGITANRHGFKDFDGDGFTDIIYSRDIMRYYGQDDFGGVEQFTLPDVGGQLIDYDMDGDLDYVLEDKWYENTGNYEFGPSMDIPDTDPTPEPEIFFTAELLRSDIDQDGDIDILTYNEFGEPLELLENDNNIEFLDPVTIATSAHISGDPVLIEVVDMDGDDLKDILFVAHSGMVLLKNTGGLNFDTPINLYPGENTPLTAQLEDMNSDGFPDILLGTRNIIAGSTLGETILYLGNSELPYRRNIHSGGGYHATAFADIDGSGWLDLVHLHNGGLSWVSVNPDTSIESTAIDVSFVQNGRLVIDDADSDGDDDIILYRDGYNDIYYYLNGESIESGNNCPSGNVYLRNQSQVDRFLGRIGSCTEIPGSLYIGRPDNEWSDIEDISALSSIREVGGNLTLQLNNMLADLQSLQSLERVHGTFYVNGHKSSSFDGMETLRYIGGDFRFNNVATIGSNVADMDAFERLDTIMGNVEILRSNVENINSIVQPVFHGDLKLDYAYQFADLDSFHLIDTIKGDLVFQDTRLQDMSQLRDIDFLGGLYVANNEMLFSFGGLKSTEHIEGDVSFSGNRYLNLNTGFDALKTVGGNLGVNGPVCLIFDSLQHIGGALGLVINQLGENSFTMLDSISDGFSLLTYTGTDLHQFSNVKKIGGRLNITNNEITSLHGLHNARLDLTYCDIVTNQKLINLEALNDSMVVNGEWRMFRNFALDYCNVYPVCRHIASGQPYQFFDNGIDCSDVSTIRCPDNVVSGFAFYDRNENGAMDTLEAPLANIHIKFNSAPDTFVTSDNGYFLTNAIAGDSISIVLSTPSEWVATTSDIIEIDSFVPGAPQNYGNNFGLKPTFEKHELKLTHNEGLFLCARTYEIYLKVFNSGTFSETGSVEINYPEHVELDPSFTDFAEHRPQDRVLVLDIGDIAPLYSIEFIVPFIAPEAELVGQEFTTQISLLREDPLGPFIEDQLEYSNVLLCSYDPNDKLVRSGDGGRDLLLNSEEGLTYTVRFQNTGNFYAENVRIIDTISTLLDLSTFEFLASSHPVEIRMMDRVIYFNFYDIQLPDSTLDFEGSQGFVSFSIKPISTDMAGVEMKNDADIYFDFNPPILTNEVVSEVVEIVAVNDQTEKAEFTVFPNPANSKLNVRIEDVNLNSELHYTIISTNGRIITSADLTDGQVDVSRLTPGMYTLQLRNDQELLGSVRFVVIR